MALASALLHRNRGYARLAAMLMSKPDAEILTAARMAAGMTSRARRPLSPFRAG